MPELLHPAVAITALEDGGFELLDRRTGFHVAIGSVPPAANGSWSDEALRQFDAFGFLGSLELDEVRSRQRPYRDRLQAEIRDEELHSLLGFARTSVPYYRTRVDIYDPDRVRGTGDLSELPLMRKRDIRLNFEDLIAEQVDVADGLSDETLRIARSSGTTEERIQVLSDMKLDRVPPGYEAVWGLAHDDKVPRTAVLTTPTCSATECHLGKLPMSERICYGTTLFLNSVEDVFSASDDSIRNFSEELCSYNPEFILANPVYLHWFSRRARELGLPLPKPELILSTYQYLSRIQKRALESTFEARVYNLYAATEMAGSHMGVECKNGSWHVREDHVIMEVVCDGERGLGNGIGSIVVTLTSNRLMPLIRYEVGDLGRMLQHDCSCELSDWQCFEFHGRRQDAMRVAGRWVTAKHVDDIISDVPGIDFYQCVQQNGSDLLVKIIPAAGSSVDRVALADLLKDLLGYETVDIRYVSRLEPEPSMKTRLTVPDHETTRRAA